MIRWTRTLMNSALTRLRVVVCPSDRRRGFVIAGFATFPCALGRSGLRVMKREGDGATPFASLPLRRLFIREDRGPRPSCRLPMRRIRPADAWCDDMKDRRYNRLIVRPPGEAEERLMRQDHLYDLIVELGWNDRPVRKGLGSAIFWHLARPGLTPTAGCVATTRSAFQRILPRLSRHCVMLIR
jgi:L,D-peptidoglycan transpeptidase YkuD (ErfK/YbiS/YcfS/YnhG family)